MSVNLNSNIIKAVQPFVNRAPVSYNFSANVYAMGGGGGGVTGKQISSNSYGGGGGGAGAFLSSSISVVPNITWTVNVGGGGAADTNGQDTYATIYNDTYAGVTTIKAQGGRTGNLSTGGNSGTGSIITPSGTFNYTGFTGGAAVGTYGGGGAGTTQNGQIANTYTGAGIGGNGGEGNVSIIFGGGGGGGAPRFDGTGGTGNDGGGDGAGGIAGYNGFNAIGYGAGGGGGAVKNDEGDIISGSGGTGSTGVFIMEFDGYVGTNAGQYNIAVTNGTITQGATSVQIIFNSGSGTFRYTAPYPYTPGN